MPVSYEHEIKLINDNSVSSPARRLLYSQRDEIRKQVNDLLDKNYIAPCRTAYAFPVVPLLKKDSSICMCVDYRKLNKKTMRCNYSVARLEDLRQTYHHILIKIEDREKIAFIFGDRKFEWLRMLIILHGTSFTLAAAMIEILSDCHSFAELLMMIVL